GVLRGVLVRRGAAPYKCVDVGNADAHTHIAATETLGYFDLVEVTRFAVVDRRPRQTPQILRLFTRRAGAIGLGDRLVRRIRLEGGGGCGRGGGGGEIGGGGVHRPTIPLRRRRGGPF